MRTSGGGSDILSGGSAIEASEGVSVCDSVGDQLWLLDGVVERGSGYSSGC